MPPMSIQCTLTAHEADELAAPAKIGVYIAVLLRCWPCAAGVIADDHVARLDAVAAMDRRPSRTAMPSALATKSGMPPVDCAISRPRRSTRPTA